MKRLIQKRASAPKIEERPPMKKAAYIGIRQPDGSVRVPGAKPDKGVEVRASRKKGK